MRPRSICLYALFLSAAVHSRGQTPTDPVLPKVREYALNYGQSLPDFTCTRVTEDTFARDAANVSSATTRTFGVEAELYVEARHEEKLLRFERRVDGKLESVVNQYPLARSFSIQEFAFVLQRIFGPNTGAVFGLQQLTKLRGKQVVEIPFEVAASHGAMVHDSGREIVVGYKGSVFVDSATGAVLQVQTRSSGFPPESAYLGIDLTFDFKPATMGGHEYVLPSRFDQRVHWHRLGSRTQYDDLVFRADYRNYRTPPAKPTFIDWAQAPYQPSITFGATK